jgi:adenosylmethionine-8-amino-7-oxononanoate aminotransferase
MKHGESEDAYVQRLAQELDDEFQKVGPEKVCAFVAETVGGSVSLPFCPF